MAYVAHCLYYFKALVYVQSPVRLPSRDAIKGNALNGRDLVVAYVAHVFLFEMKKYEFLEHTADIRVRVLGTTITELFQNAAEALFSILVNHAAKKNTHISIELKASSYEELLVNWLNELLSRFYADKFLSAGYPVVIENSQNDYILRAKLEGEIIDFSEHAIKDEVKAATYHGLSITKHADRLSAEVVFDV